MSIKIGPLVVELGNILWSLEESGEGFQQLVFFTRQLLHDALDCETDEKVASLLACGLLDLRKFRAELVANNEGNAFNQPLEE